MIVTLQDAAALLEIGQRSIRQLCVEKKIHAKPFQRSFVLESEHFAAFIGCDEAIVENHVTARRPIRKIALPAAAKVLGVSAKRLKSIVEAGHGYAFDVGGRSWMLPQHVDLVKKALDDGVIPRRTPGSPLGRAKAAVRRLDPSDQAAFVKWIAEGMPDTGDEGDDDGEEEPSEEGEDGAWGDTPAEEEVEA